MSSPSASEKQRWQKKQEEKKKPEDLIIKCQKLLDAKMNTEDFSYEVEKTAINFDFDIGKKLEKIFLPTQSSSVCNTTLLKESDVRAFAYFSW